MPQPETVDSVVSPTIGSYNLTLKQERFITAYKQLGDATKAAISAGYSAKSANVEANRLLKNPKILEAVKQLKIARNSAITKDDFVGMAIEDYKSLDTTEPNKPRFLDLAGKALGYTGSGALNGPQSVTNNVQININEVNTLPQLDKWNVLRGLLEQ